MIQGTLDTYGTRCLAAARYPAAIPGAQLWLLDGAGHEPHLEAAEEYLTQVLTFLGRYSP